MGASPLGATKSHVRARRLHERRISGRLRWQIRPSCRVPAVLTPFLPGGGEQRAPGLPARNSAELRAVIREGELLMSLYLKRFKRRRRGQAGRAVEVSEAGGRINAPRLPRSSPFRHIPARCRPAGSASRAAAAGCTSKRCCHRLGLAGWAVVGKHDPSAQQSPVTSRSHVTHGTRHGGT